MKSIFKFVKNIWNLRQCDLISLQMGKVGSSSILMSYPSSFQGHSWDSEPPGKYFSSRNTSSVFGHLFSLFRWKVKFLFVRRFVEHRLSKGERVKLIVGVREPVSRNISGYFQSLNRREDDFCVKSQIMKFFCFCPHFVPLFWIDNEIRRNFDVDIYAFPFDRDAGFSSFSSGFFDIFVYKLESLNSLESEIGDFICVKNFKLLSDNMTKNSPLSKLYDEFSNRIKFNRSYLDFMYQSKMVTHFYSQDEIDGFYARWSGQDN